MNGPETPTPTAPDAVEAVAQSRGEPQIADTPAPLKPEPGEGERYRISARIDRSALTRLYERRPDEPLYRPLQIYALNPAVSRLDGGLAATKIQYEPLKPGPVGSILAVDHQDAAGQRYERADLDQQRVLLEGGYRPSLSSPAFHQQMVYTIGMMTYNHFKVALGRTIAWSFKPNDPDVQTNRLLLRPHGACEANAWYDRSRGEIVFGYFKAEASTPVVREGEGFVYTCVSHDIIAHEMSHALLDSLRANFSQPTHSDVLAFHEAFADLIAFFQHFTFEDVVRAEIGRTKGRLEQAELLVDIAKEFGRGLGGKRALRTLVDLADEFPPAESERIKGQILRYDEAGTEPHDRGRVLARAVFSAFLTLYKRRTRRFIKLATGGTGTLPEGDLAEGLIDFLIAEVRRLANQFLAICIRAIDYCPPIDIRFGDYLRAIITADQDVVPDDDWAYREAIIHAFGKRGIYGEGTLSMAEDALVWRGPRCPIEAEQELSFGRMAFDGDPAKPVSVAEMRRQAGVLGQLATRPDCAEEFGLVSPLSPDFASGDYDLPIVESIRSARRVGPDQQVVFDIIAEIIQARHVKDSKGRQFKFYGGATVILGPQGEIRFIVRKRVDHPKRLAQQQTFMGKEGAAWWQIEGKRTHPLRDLSRRLCVRGPQKPGASTDTEVAKTVICVIGPDHLKESSQIMLDGRFSRIETHKPASVPIGQHTFQINTDTARYREQHDCPAGGTTDAPIFISVKTKVPER